MNLNEYHSQFPGSVKWRITEAGVDIEGKGVESPSPAEDKRAQEYMAKYKLEYAKVSVELDIPVELLVACSLTESAAVNPETCFREESGYVSDAVTPRRISAGFCQLLISTAQSVMNNPAIDRKWLFSVSNSLRACATYMKQQSAKTGFDPILAACAYNSGGVYENTSPGNRWRLKQWPIGGSDHADRFSHLRAPLCFT